MKALCEIFRLELTALVRSGTLALLTAVSVLWVLVFPFLARGDGTAEGARELYLRYSLGGVFALLVVCLLASATGTLARERAAKRLQLTVVRPVRYSAIALGKIAAHVLVGAVVLGLAALIVLFRTETDVRCSHVLAPVLPSPAEEAKLMYDTYMKDPSTSDEIRKAPKAAVLRLLTQRAIDHYQTIQTNDVASWKFEGLEGLDGLSVRMRFTNQYEMRQDVAGTFRLGGLTGVVSNITQAVLTIPLKGESGQGLAPGDVELSFSNRGGHPVMFRPRKDLNLLVPADGFSANLLRGYLVMVAVLTFVIAFGTFLSAALSRPVALFVAIVMLLVSEMSPSVLEQYPDALETSRIDRIGLAMTRVAAELTHPISSLSPLEALSKDECIEARLVGQAWAVDFLALPLLFAFLAAFVLPRKQED